MARRAVFLWILLVVRTYLPAAKAQENTFDSILRVNKRAMTRYARRTQESESRGHKGRKCQPTKNRASMSALPSSSEMALFEGDILLSNALKKALAEGNNLQLSTKLKDGPDIWKEQIVPFAVSPKLDKWKNLIYRVLWTISSRTCLKFQEINFTWVRKFIYFQRKQGCWAELETGGYKVYQVVSVGSGCESESILHHLIGHALGLWHLQSRQDRDKHLEVRVANVQRGKLAFFKKYPHGPTDAATLVYDPKSVMHFSNSAFSGNGRPTLSVKTDQSKNQMGSKYLSDYDLLQINVMYNCSMRRGNKRGFGAWSSWSACQISPCVQKRQRFCFSAPTRREKEILCPGADKYGVQTETKACDWRQCSRNREGAELSAYQWGKWSAYSSCSVSCGTGAQTRQRSCRDNRTGRSGSVCPGVQTDTRKCYLPACTLAYQWSGWSAYSSCSVSCGSGVQTRQRSCRDSRTGRRGSSCPGSERETRRCDRSPCTTAYQWSGWSAYSSCSVSCGSGVQTRQRSCRDSRTGRRGRSCPGSETETRGCNRLPCRPAYQWSGWSAYSSCSVSCGSGVQTRQRNCRDSRTGRRGSSCPGSERETRRCSSLPCRPASQWSMWSAFSSCSVSCGNGVQTRRRSCRDNRTGRSSNSCPGSETDTRKCYTGTCMPAYQWSGWSTYSSCSVSCGNGVQTRQRSCRDNRSGRRGRSCPGSERETRRCNRSPCRSMKVADQWSAWSAYSSCSVSCCKGAQTRQRSCRDNRTCRRSNTCPGSEMQSQNCYQPACKPTYQWSIWSAYSSCSVSCGSGVQKRQRSCRDSRTGRRGSSCLGSEMETQTCNRLPCRPAYQWSGWSAYSSCSVTCGRGVQTRQRSCRDRRTGRRGSSCPGPETETRICNSLLCRPAYQWTGWSAYSSCSVSCGSGVETRQRSCREKNTAKRSSSCPGSERETRVCNRSPCRSASQWSMWSAFSSCSVSCGNGVQTRRRSCRDNRTGRSSNSCPGSETDTRMCYTGTCRPAYKWSEWSSYSSCSVSCGSGVQTRQRSCGDSGTGRRGSSCPGSETETRRCNQLPCRSASQWSMWSAFSSCSVSCGNGVQTRRRSCRDNRTGRSSNSCPGSETDMRMCYTGTCRPVYQWSGWSSYSSCSVSCGSGMQTRQRSCRDNRTGRRASSCPGSEMETRRCNLSPCRSVYKWSGWSAYSSCSVSCGSGVQTRQRSCRDSSTGRRGDSCPGYERETRRCNRSPCRAVSQWSTWSGYSSCSVSCGNGVQTRRRSCRDIRTGRNSRNCPGSDTETGKCYLRACLTVRAAYQWTGWSAYSTCSVTCGSGVQTRQRSCKDSRTGRRSNSCQGSGTETRGCYQPSCRRVRAAYQWSTWSAYSACSVTCGDGIQTRQRICIEQSTGGPGNSCSGSATETRKCNPSTCRPAFFTDFESNDLGLWQNTNSDELDWRRRRGPTPSEGTGPSGDHTTGRGYYLYIESSGASAGSRARLISRSMSGTQDMCLKFFFSMKGRAVGSLKVFLKSKTGMEKEIFESTGKTLSEKDWHLALVNIKRPNVESKLIIQAEIGDLGPREKYVGKSDIAIDDVHLALNACKGQPVVGVSQRGEECPKGIPKVKCKWNPCLYAKCPSSPYAACQSDVCGACRAKFMYRGVEILDCYKETCGKDVPTAICEANPCLQAKCKDYPDAQCSPSFCGICTAKFYMYGKVIPRCSKEVSSQKTYSVWANWGAWSRCTKSCGSGTRVRYRQCNGSRYSGAQCSGSHRQMEVCSTNPCRQVRAVNGNWGEWSKWTTCTTTCDIGKRTRTRSCSNPSPTFGGRPCLGTGYMVASCFVKACGMDTEFENGFVKMKNVLQGDNMNWEVYRKGLRLEGNMPRYDHNGRPGAYVYLDGYQRQKGDRGRLSGPLMPAIQGGCLFFSYATKGEFTGHLAVIIRYFGVPKRPEIVFYKLVDGLRLQNWQVGQASISSPSSTYQVIFEGAFDQIKDQRRRRQSLLVLDNVNLRKGKCSRSNVIETKQERDNLCKDQDPRCKSWARGGECWANAEYMRKGCCKSCMLLKSTCKDEERLCSSWVGQGECQRNPRYMTVYCRRSCNTC